MKYTAIVTIFSRHSNGQWLTTGDVTVVPDLSRAKLHSVVARYSGPGVKIDAEGVEGEAWTDLGGNVLHFADAALLDERFHARVLH